MGNEILRKKAADREVLEGRKRSVLITLLGVFVSLKYVAGLTESSGLQKSKP